MLLAAVCKSPERTWSDADINECLCLRNKCISTGGGNTKHQFWNSAVSDLSGKKHLHLFDSYDFEISAPQFPTLYSPARNGVVLDTVVHHNIRYSCDVAFDILG
jgi:hypothetical protein